MREVIASFRESAQRRPEKKRVDLVFEKWGLTPFIDPIYWAISSTAANPVTVLPKP